MKCNLKELAVISDGPCVIEGRLNYKKTSNGSMRDGVFKERWFRLVKNYLFYFRLSEMGKFDTKSPAGVFVMENSVIQMEHGQHIPFAFSISFVEEPEKRHVLAARTQEVAAGWVSRLRACSYEYLRGQLYALQAKIFAISGYDPLLLVPRNDGSKLWAPAVPFSTVSACTSASNQGFCCHLHTSGHDRPPTYTLDRSHSDALLANKHRATFTSHLQELSRNERIDEHKEINFCLERSVTAPKMLDVQYIRPAPSPPVRKKSPRMQRTNGDRQSEELVEMSKRLGTIGILDSSPSVPPRRKISPKNEASQEDDLIKF